MIDAKVATFANVNRATVSNYRAFMAGDTRRGKYVSTEDAEAIAAVDALTQNDVVIMHFDIYGDDAVLTQAKAGTEYQIGRLSERVREINAKFAKAKSPTRIVNRNADRKGFEVVVINGRTRRRGIQAEYVVRMWGEK